MRMLSIGGVEGTVFDINRPGFSVLADLVSDREFELVDNAVNGLGGAADSFVKADIIGDFKAGHSRHGWFKDEELISILEPLGGNGEMNALINGNIFSSGGGSKSDLRPGKEGQERDEDNER